MVLRRLCPFGALRVFCYLKHRSSLATKVLPMKIPSPPEDSVLMQAAHWCMRLRDKDCTKEERMTFQNWIQSDPVHAFEYARMLEIWDLNGQLPAHAPL
jgi:hypothetical protein